jgi:RecJ-like exonuclease
MAQPDADPDEAFPSIAEILRHHGITPCSQCHGEGFIRSRTPMLEMTAGCGRCDGTGEEPKCAECGGTGTVERECPDGWVPFPCDCQQ